MIIYYPTLLQLRYYIIHSYRYRCTFLTSYIKFSLVILEPFFLKYTIIGTFQIGNVSYCIIG